MRIGLIIGGVLLVGLGKGPLSAIGLILSFVGIIWLIIRIINKKKAMGKSNTQAWRCPAAGNLPAGAETRAFEILQNVIVKNGGSNDFQKIRTYVESKKHYFKVWSTLYKSPKEEAIRLFFTLGHHQHYTDLNGKKRNGDICSISFDFYFTETFKENALTIGNEAEQEINNYFRSMGLPLCK